MHLTDMHDLYSGVNIYYNFALTAPPPPPRYMPTCHILTSVGKSFATKHVVCITQHIITHSAFTHNVVVLRMHSTLQYTEQFTVPLFGGLDPITPNTIHQAIPFSVKIQVTTVSPI